MGNNTCYLRVRQADGITRKCRLVVNNAKKSLILNNNLPRDYQEVEYIESTGTQHLETDIVPKLGTTIDCEFSVTNTTDSRNYIFGCDNSGHGIQFSYSPTSFFGAGGKYITPTIAVNQNKHHIYIDNSVFTLDDEVVFTGGTNYTTVKTLLLFGAKSNPDYYGKCRIYYCKIYDNGNLVRDFIPCYRKDNGTIGMYDKVSKQLFINCGTGTFTKGGNVY